MEAQLKKQDEFTFDEKTHTYRLNGVKIPSVTQAIDEAGLMNLSMVDKNLLKAKADIGDKVHKTTELYDRQRLNMETLHPVLKSYLNGWIKFKEDFHFFPVYIEYKMYHPLYRYAGKIDRIGTLINSRVKSSILAQVDIKTGVPFPSYALQSAGYTEMYNNGKPKRQQVQRRFAVYLHEDGTYKVHPYEDPRDIKIFLSCLTITNYKRGLSNGKSKRTNQ